MEKGTSVSIFFMDKLFMEKDVTIPSLTVGEKKKVSHP